jgi:glycosyltransferase involved in cell wall biosynthesis
MNHLKVLLSAYACEPGKGSEPGVGWNIALQMAKDHEVWVLTRANNRSAIELGLCQTSSRQPHFIYYDLPRWARWWKRGSRGIQLYYYLWQIGIYFVARKLHTHIQFDLAHHVTFGKYWAPSPISFLPIPFVWGPVGGGESAPKAFWTGLGVRGLIFEMFRELARLMFENDPLVRFTARRSCMTLAKSPETSLRLVRLGPKRAKVFGESAISSEELDWLAQKLHKESEFQSIKFISMGRFLPWKGFALGLKAFSIAHQEWGHKELKNAEYWLVGDGAEFLRLRTLSDKLAIAPNVKFWGRLSREDTMKKLAECQVLVHPSLHDSGGWVCLEAMAMGKPVICLDLGGPATQVQKNTGFKIPAHTPAQVVRDMAHAMTLLAQDQTLRSEMGNAGRQLVTLEYTWERKAELLNGYYKRIIAP